MLSKSSLSDKKMSSPVLMVSRCSHRISPAVQSDIRPRKSSRSRLHSWLPWRPLRSEPRQWRPNSAWHQSSQWFTSHSDHSVGSGHTQVHKCTIVKCIKLCFRSYLAADSTSTLWKVTADPLLGEASKTGLHCLAQDLLTSRGKRRDIQGVQLWDRYKIH